MPSPTIEEVETRLETVQCAICKESSFGVDRRFMQSDGEWRGVCKKCRYSFPIYTDMEFYQRTQPDLSYRLKEMYPESIESARKAMQLAPKSAEPRLWLAESLRHHLIDADALDLAAAARIQIRLSPS
jgi:transposase-like protein